HGNPWSARLGRSVVDLTDRASCPGDRGDVHDLPVADTRLTTLRSLDHMPTDGLQGEEDTGEIDADDLVPLLTRHLMDHRGAHDARIVEQSVDPAPFLHHVVDGTVDEGLVGDAAGEGPDGPARLFAKRLQRVSIQIDRPHLSTEANDQLRDLAPDTLSRSRYQDA